MLPCPLAADTTFTYAIIYQILRQPDKITILYGLATQPYSATEVAGWQHKLSRVSQNRAAVHAGAIGDILS
jgi:hypothetical protein